MSPVLFSAAVLAPLCGCCTGIPRGGALMLGALCSGRGVPASFPPVFPDALAFPPLAPFTEPLLLPSPPVAEELPPVVAELLSLEAVAGPDDEDAADSADELPPSLLDSAGPLTVPATEVTTSETGEAGTASSALATAVPRSQKPPAKPATASPFRTNLAMNVPSELCAQAHEK